MKTDKPTCDNRQYLRFLPIILIGIFLAGCSDYSQTDKTIPKIKKGSIDLSNWDLKTDGIINLDGKWEFYHNQFLDPSLGLDLKQDQPEYIEVPGLWNKSKSIENPKPRRGYGTYRLRLSNLSGNQLLGIELSGIHTAYRLYINNELVGSMGTTATSRESSEPSRLSKIYHYQANSERLEILLQVSNFEHKDGGILRKIRFGDYDVLKGDREQLVHIDIFFVSVFFIMAIYHFGLFAARIKDRSTLYFGIFCLMISVRILTINWVDIPESLVSWKSLYKIDLVTFHLTLPVFILFLSSLYPGSFSKTVVKISKYFILLAFPLIILLPVFIVSQNSIFNYFIIIGGGIYLIYGLSKAVQKNQEGSLIFLASIVFVLIAIVNDILHYNLIIDTFDSQYVGLFIMIVSQSSVLSMRFSKAYSNIEQKVLERTKELASANREVLKQKEAYKASYEDLKKLSDIGYEIISTLEIESIVDRIYKNLNDIMPAQGLDIGLIDEKRENLIFPMVIEDGEMIERRSYNLTDDPERLAVKCYQYGETIATNDLYHAFPDYPDPHAGFKVSSVICLPISVSDQINGVLTVYNIKRNAFSEQHLYILKNLAVFISIAVENAKTYKKLESSYSQLKELDQYKESMTAMIVHDFKNSLNTIISYTEGEVSNQRKEAIHQAGQFMLNMVMNILDVQKFESTRINLSEANYPMSKIIEDALSRLSYMMEQKSIQLTFKKNSSHIARVDYELILRTVINILSNAIKYVSHNGKIEISTGEEKGFIKVCIKDNGPGIPEERIDSIFQKYIQYDPKHSGASRSTGIGLTFCKMVVEAHGGIIGVTSEQGEGACFGFTVPAVLEERSNATDEQQIHYGVNEVSLNKSDTELLQPYIKKLQQWEVYDYSEVSSVLSEIPDSSEKLKEWKDKINNALYNGNEQLYDDLIKQPEKHGKTNFNS